MTDWDMAEVDADPANYSLVDPKDEWDRERALREPYLGSSRVRLPDAWELRELNRPPTQEEIRRNKAKYRREEPLERARLAAEDPTGEADAVAPLTPVRARQVLLDEAEAKYRTRSAYPTRVADMESACDLLTRLGADPNRGRGLIRCPAHDDRGPSLSWRLTSDGRALLHCFAGCDFRSILAAA